MSDHDTKHHCGICGQPTQTYHEAPCVECKKRIGEQIHKYLAVAGMIAVLMPIQFELKN